jgi:DNA invertase Pin-like site-specific DNA recombinase
MAARWCRDSGCAAKNLVGGGGGRTVNGVLQLRCLYTLKQASIQKIFTDTLLCLGVLRFARDLVAQELGVLLLIKRDVRALTASGDDLTDTSDPSRVMMRQIAGSFAQYEKTRLVTKLRGARERVRETRGKCEGRKSYAERDPELVLAAKRLHRRSPKGHRRSLREIARELQAMGYTNKRGAPYSASCVKSMVEGPSP